MGVLPYMENSENNKNKSENKENIEQKQKMENNLSKNILQDGAGEGEDQPSYQRVKIDEDNLTWKEIEDLEKELSFLKDVKLRFFVELDRKKMRFEEIYNLKPGEIITFNRKLDDYVPVFLKNIVFGVGELVNINDNFGVRLIDIRVERFLKDIPGKD